MWTWILHNGKMVDWQYDFDGYVYWIEEEGDRIKEGDTFFPADKDAGETLAFWLNDRGVPKF